MKHLLQIISLILLYVFTLSCGGGAGTDDILEDPFATDNVTPLTRTAGSISLRPVAEKAVSFFYMDGQFAQIDFKFEMIDNEGFGFDDLTREHFKIYEDGEFVGQNIPVLNKVSGNTFVLSDFSNANNGFHDLRIELKYHDVDYVFEDKFAISDSFNNPHAPVTYNAFLEPIDAGIGDLDGDNDIDIVVLERDGNSLMVMKNIVDNTFNNPIPYSISETPIQMDLLEVNGSDNHHDAIVITKGNSNNLRVMLGNGDLTFNAPIITSVSDSLVSMASANINTNTDNIVDVAVLSEESKKLHIMLGDGNGNFTLSQSLSTRSSPKQVLAIQANPTVDNFVDLCVVNSGADAVGVYLGKGDGSFADAYLLAVGQFPTSITVNDLNNDGFEEIVTANENSLDLSILYSNGDGSFQSASSKFIGTIPKSLTSLYFRDEGINIGFVSSEYGNISILKNDGTGSFPYMPNGIALKRNDSRLKFVNLQGTIRRTDIILLDPEKGAVHIFLAK